MTKEMEANRDKAVSDLLTRMKDLIAASISPDQEHAKKLFFKFSESFSRQYTPEGKEFFIDCLKEAARRLDAGEREFFGPILTLINKQLKFRNLITKVKPQLMS